ncbi:hypothetical protein FMM05_12885 [Flavobacterium zepuense]|uniref:Uncharacterized protein n=1 Tax=Flavobacterium zepuense TaxID=2593302 RepID=A0A552UZB4_9FLAO|nr:hypothetical protein [Flavobacterium zepuense]TRW23551.1 hypothetical protein FMM05_12885 [Flavobacterium zepuense]
MQNTCPPHNQNHSHGDIFHKISSDVVSFNHKPKTDNQQVDKFLDIINDIRKDLKERTDAIENIYIQIENLTWHAYSDSELVSLRELIKLCHTSVKENNNFIQSINVLSNNGLLPIEISNFREAIDDFAELVEDIDSTYNRLINDSDFVQITKHLEKL